MKNACKTLVRNADGRPPLENISIGGQYWVHLAQVPSVLFQRKYI
jgi:hypothetical protein